MELRYRPGYFGFLAGDEDATRVGLADLLSSPLDTTSVGLVSAAVPMPDGTGGFQLLLVVDAHDLTLQPSEGRMVGAVDVGIVFHSGEDGEIYVLPGSAHPVSLTEIMFAQPNPTFVITQAVDTEGRSGSFRVVVQDRTSGDAGSVWVDANVAQN